MQNVKEKLAKGTREKIIYEVDMSTTSITGHRVPKHSNLSISKYNFFDDFDAAESFADGIKDSYEEDISDEELNSVQNNIGETLYNESDFESDPENLKTDECQDEDRGESYEREDEREDGIGVEVNPMGLYEDEECNPTIEKESFEEDIEDGTEKALEEDNTMLRFEMESEESHEQEQEHETPNNASSFVKIPVNIGDKIYIVYREDKNSVTLSTDVVKRISISLTDEEEPVYSYDTKKSDHYTQSDVNNRIFFNKDLALKKIFEITYNF